MAILESGLTEDIVIKRIHVLWKKLNPEYQPPLKLTIPGTNYLLTGLSLDAFFSLCSSQDPTIPRMVTLLEAVRAGKIKAQMLTKLIEEHEKVRGRKGISRAKRDECRNAVRHILTQIHKSHV